MAWLRVKANVRARAVASYLLTSVGGDDEAGVHCLRMEQAIRDLSAVAAWSRRNRVTIGCSHCRTWLGVPDSALGPEIACPNCGEPLILNPFTIDANWRPIARAWRGERA